eukprot:m.142465 g.142465  ORF g.142465 m.142465 type:complete len:525 (+) comp16157_c0_seq2:1046-2620(+)
MSRSTGMLPGPTYELESQPLFDSNDDLKQALAAWTSLEFATDAWHKRYQLINARIPWSTNRIESATSASSVNETTNFTRPAPSVGEQEASHQHEPECRECGQNLPVPRFCMRCSVAALKPERVAQSPWHHDSSETQPTFRYKHELIARLNHLENTTKAASSVHQDSTILRECHHLVQELLGQPGSESAVSLKDLHASLLHLKHQRAKLPSKPTSVSTATASATIKADSSPMTVPASIPSVSSLPPSKDAALKPESSDGQATVGVTQGPKHVTQGTKHVTQGQNDQSAKTETTDGIQGPKRAEPIPLQPTVDTMTLPGTLRNDEHAGPSDAKLPLATAQANLIAPHLLASTASQEPSLDQRCTKANSPRQQQQPTSPQLQQQQRPSQQQLPMHQQLQLQQQQIQQSQFMTLGHQTADRFAASAAPYLAGLSPAAQLLSRQPSTSIGKQAPTLPVAHEARSPVSTADNGTGQELGEDGHEGSPSPSGSLLSNVGGRRSSRVRQPTIKSLEAIANEMDGPHSKKAKR